MTRNTHDIREELPHSPSNQSPLDSRSNMFSFEKVLLQSTQTEIIPDEFALKVYSVAFRIFDFAYQAFEGLLQELHSNRRCMFAQKEVDSGLAEFLVWFLLIFDGGWLKSSNTPEDRDRLLDAFCLVLSYYAKAGTTARQSGEVNPLVSGGVRGILQFRIENAAPLASSSALISTFPWLGDSTTALRALHDERSRDYGRVPEDVYIVGLQDRQTGARIPLKLEAPNVGAYVASALQAPESEATEVSDAANMKLGTTYGKYQDYMATSLEEIHSVFAAINKEIHGVRGEQRSKLGCLLFCVAFIREL